MQPYWCPTCRRKDFLDFGYSAFEGEPSATYVACECGQTGPFVRGQDEQGAIAAWNKMVLEAAASPHN